MYTIAGYGESSAKPVIGASFKESAVICPP